jgi:hypothetical protein
MILGWRLGGKLLITLNKGGNFMYGMFKNIVLGT